MVAGSGIKSEDSATQKAEGSRFLADLCSRAACPLANDFVWSVQQAGLDACDKGPGYRLQRSAGRTPPISFAKPAGLLSVNANARFGGAIGGDAHDDRRYRNCFWAGSEPAVQLTGERS